MRDHETAFNDFSSRRTLAFGSAVAPVRQHEAELFLPHMRGACVTVGNTVHTLFRVSGRPRARSGCKTAPLEAREDFAQDMHEDLAAGRSNPAALRKKTG